ncbi:TIGR03790 family protein [Nannocystis pusilla]|uniref:TIGR03790 family protein n=1 Tax=Nannocystis pusilla TaxID=889268 RepID=A0A9X3J0Z8_9BACT|nr:TIGR03790 family protein [Nannocystis pusilla]
MAQHQRLPAQGRPRLLRPRTSHRSRSAATRGRGPRGLRTSSAAPTARARSADTLAACLSARLSAALLFACACSPSGGDGTDSSPITGTTSAATTDEPTSSTTSTSSTTGAEPVSSTSSGTATGTTAEPLTTTGTTGDRPVAPTVILPRASIQPEELAVLANDQDPQSMAVAAHYMAARGLPADNLLVLSFAPPGDALAADVFAGLKGQVDAALGPDIQALAIAWTKPYRVECQSLVSAFALGHDPAKYCSQPCSETAPSGYYDSSSLRPFTDLGLRPAMHLAGTSLENVQALIDRGVAADATAPVGTGWFVRTTDTARSVRWPSSPPRSTSGAPSCSPWSTSTTPWAWARTRSRARPTSSSTSPAWPTSPGSPPTPTCPARSRTTSPPTAGRSATAGR